MRRPALKLINLIGRIGDRFAVAAGLAVIGVGVLATYVVVISVNTAPFTSPYKLNAIVPADAPILRPGDDVRVAGSRAGTVQSVDYVPGGRRVTFDLNSGPVGTDSTAIVRQRGFSGSVYLLVVRGDTRHPLPAAGTIPLSRTSSTVELSQVVAAFDARARAALTRELAGYGAGFVGRGADISELLGNLPDLLTTVVPVMRGFSPAPGQLSGMLTELNRTMLGLSPPGSRQLAPFVHVAAVTAGTLRARIADVDRLVEVLPSFERQGLTNLPSASDLLGQTADAAVALTPALRRVNTALPAFNRLLTLGGGLLQLPRLARALGPTLTAGSPALRPLDGVGLSLGPFARPVVPFANYLAPYRADLVGSMVNFNQWSQWSYPVGLAWGHHAVRFEPVFTCARPRDPYPKPNQSRSETVSTLVEACQ